MPRKDGASEAQPQSIEEKLDVVIQHLERLDRRDRARMIGSYVKTMISLGWILFIIWSTWYFIAKAPEIMSETTKMMMQQSMGGTSDNEDLMQQLQKYLGQ